MAAVAHDRRRTPLSPGPGLSGPGDSHRAAPSPFPTTGPDAPPRPRAGEGPRVAATQHLQARLAPKKYLPISETRRGWAERRKGLGKCLKVPQTRAGSTKPTLDSKTMEPNYGATDDEANTPLMEDHGLLTEKPVRRGRAAAAAAVVGTTLFLAGTVSQTGQQKIADLRASLRTPRGTPSVDWYDITVTQDQFWQLTCDLGRRGPSLALCGLTAFGTGRVPRRRRQVRAKDGQRDVRR